MIKAVVFDLDDTLFPESSFRDSGFNFIAKYLQEKGIKITVHDIETAYAVHPHKTFDTLVANHGIPYSASDLVERYRTHAAELEFYPEALETLQKIKHTYALGLISDGPAAMQRNKVKSLDIQKFFKHMIFSDEKGTSKPDVALFEEMKKELHASEGEIMYIADNELKDFIGARKAGFITVKYNSGGVYKDASLGEEYKADFEIKKHSEIFNLLNQM